MSYRDTNSAQQAIRRNLNSVNLEPENRKALEAVTVAMAAAGKPGEFVTYMQALEKTETQVDLKTVADNVNELVNVIKAKEQPTTDTPSNIEVHLSDIGHGIKALCERVKTLETA